tara:strand:+ start:3505 stop:4218 length:714 start_codon:yes stop_codon:yes gene_type:complete
MSRLPAEKSALKKRILIDIVAMDPGVTNQFLARELKVKNETIASWRNDPKMIEAVYDRYMELAGKELPLVVGALLEEAKLGNVRAAELVLKHFGKLQDTLVVKVEAPFMQHLKAAKIDHIEDAEIVEDLGPEAIGESIKLSQEILAKLPPRDKTNDHPSIKNTIDNKRVKAIDSEILKRKKSQEKAKYERKKLNKKAKALGLEPMPGGRPSKSERDAWLKKLKKLEAEKIEKNKNKG